MSQQVLSPPPAFSDAGAQDNAVVVREAQEWIEEVTGKKFGPSFRESLKDGVLLCELMKKINPGSISRINKLKSPIAHLDNIQLFLNACRELGMKDSQLFDMMDLQSPKVTPKKSGVKRDEGDRKIRSVCVTLYWLGRIVAEMEDYRGPQLDLSAFSNIMDDSQYSDDSTESPIVDPPDHYQLELGNHVSSPEASTPCALENGMGLTFEQEQTADQLLADIQSAVDEMLQDFQSGYIPEEIPDQIEEMTKDGSTSMGISVHMISRNGGFGFQVIGGANFNYSPEVERVLPGSAAEDAGIQTGDKIVSVNKEDVSRLTHMELVSLIKKAGSEGSMLIGLIREGHKPAAKIASDAEDADKQVSTPSEDLEEDDDEPPLFKESSTTQPPRRNSFGAQPLPTLVEYQEETLLEQITEMIEKSPPPPVSPPNTPTGSPLLPTSPLTPGQVSDDRESIERELQEIVLMEMAATSEQKHKLEDEDITDGGVEQLEQEIEEALNAGKVSKSPTEEKFDLEFDLPPPFIESPPPPKPTTEAPRRRSKESPPPVKAKPKRPVSFVQATTLPPKDPEPERARSATPTKPRFTPPPPPVASPPLNSSSPILTVSEVTVAPAPQPLQAVTTTIGASSPQQPASLTTPISQPLQASVNVSTVLTAQKPQISTNAPSSKPSTGYDRIALLPQTQKDSPTIQPLEAVDMTTTQTTSSTEAILTAPVSQAKATPTAPISQMEATPTTPISQTEATPITPTSQPLQAKEVGVVSPDDVEIVGNIKIHCVQRTRWTPKGSSTERVTSPEEQSKKLQQQHFTHLWAKGTPNKQTPTSITPTHLPTSTQNGFPEPAQKSLETPTGAPMRASPRAARNGNPRRHTQPVGMAHWQLPLTQNDRGFSASSKVLTQNQQHTPRTNWKSQEELRIHKTTPTGPPHTEQRNKTTIRQQSMPTQQHKTQSLPRGSMQNWRVGRHNTWSRGMVQQPIDGQHSAFAIKAKNPYDLCSRCHQSLGTDSVMSIPNLKIQYHVKCFVCRVCRAQLVRSAHNTPVLIKGMHPHCQYCGSTGEGELVDIFH